MFTLEHPTFRLDNFEGPLEFLLHLVQKHELEIGDIPLKEITRQFCGFLREEELDVDAGAEYMSATASLLLLKSKLLLPQQEGDEEEVIEEEDPRFEIIHQLVEYCRFRDTAHKLHLLEERQQGTFYRGVSQPELKKPPGVEHLSLEDLALVFQDLLKRAEQNKGGVIQEEEWRVCDKIRWIRGLLKASASAPLSLFFAPTKSKGELIVTFLAVLELMKEGALHVVKEPDTQHIHIRRAP